ncbi:chloride channel protein [Alicyclobacillus sp. ALC3]|uniref:chloride channel protein n=1 Tax=Alicyclobacillus sp. ALC3 TaxID=2796143 RepID=UPI0023795A68|nr:chloride channel protein [Alicyclobacillus sp. ALC3]WDL97561.1 chloride channel protein [Alicyclobacillus sp. ALC3]
MSGRLRKTGDFTTSTQILRLSAAALLIGAACAFIAIVLLKMIYFFTNLSFYHRLSFAYITPTHNHLHTWVIIPPIVGALLIGLMARFGSEKIRGHGIPEAIEAMLINESKVQPRVAFWKPISAAISIGSGGPFGAEGPIIMTGGSFGSLFSQFLHFSSIERRILLVAGAAGGMSATFASPVSAVLFAVELLVFEFKPRSLVPIAIASAVADAIRIAVIGPGPLFGMPNLEHVPVSLLLVATIIGVVGSFLAVLLTWAIYGVEDAFRKLPIHWMWWPALGAVVIGVGGMFSPRALGVGYDSIAAMLNVKLALYTLLTLLIVKTIIWVVALGSGTSGGILAPILIIGGSLGGVAADLFHAPHPGVWALLGMSAIFSGVTRTPLTSIVFPLELTHNLGALLPLLITSAIATGLSSLILPRSILTEKIVRRGLHLSREYHTDPLQMHYCSEVAFVPANSIAANTHLGDVAESELIRYTTASWLKVEDDERALNGIVLAWEVLRGSKLTPQSRIADLIAEAPVVFETDTAKTALSAMVETSANWVRVVDLTGATSGFITPAQLFELRKRERAEEADRSRVFSLTGRSESVAQDGAGEVPPM